jgi:hypothetical protein
MLRNLAALGIAHFPLPAPYSTSSIYLLRHPISHFPLKRQIGRRSMRAGKLAKYKPL